MSDTQTDHAICDIHSNRQHLRLRYMATFQRQHALHDRQADQLLTSSLELYYSAVGVGIEHIVDCCITDG